MGMSSLTRRAPRREACAIHREVAKGVVEFHDNAAYLADMMVRYAEAVEDGFSGSFEEFVKLQEEIFSDPLPEEPYDLLVIVGVGGYY